VALIIIVGLAYPFDEVNLKKYLTNSH